VISARFPAIAPQIPSPSGGSIGTNTVIIAMPIESMAFELEADLSFIGLVPGGELG
jgi:hypothetical protein